MSKCLLIADLHLGHRKIIGYEPSRRTFESIEDHDSFIEDSWRSVVGSRDVVYVVGDVAWNRKALERFRSFPGIKKLVMGNHDRHDMLAYLQVFRKVSAYEVLDGDVLVSHVPVHRFSLEPRFRGQIHGHTHGHGSPAGPYLSVCCERVAFAPITLEEALSQLPPKRDS